METRTARDIADAYRWQHRLGNSVVAAPHRHIVANPGYPDVWVANHAEQVSVATRA